jgi:hypothetical protein
MERSDERARANLEPEQVPGQTDPLDTTAERRPEDLPEGSQQEQETGGEYQGREQQDRPRYGDTPAADSQDPAMGGASASRTDETGGRYENAGDRRDYDQTGDRRDYEQAPEGQDYGRQPAAAAPEGATAGTYGTTAEGQAAQGQAAASYDEAAERKAVQPAGGAGTSTLDPSDTRDQSAPMSNTPETAGTAGTAGNEEQPGVLPRQDAQGFQTRWEAVQGVFVDDPQAATEQADALVGEVMDQLLRLRQEYLTQLRGAVGDGADTEAMRIALRRYRAFFNVLLGT